jgi:hypothetical protein
VNRGFWKCAASSGTYNLQSAAYVDEEMLCVSSAITHAVACLRLLRFQTSLPIEFGPLGRRTALCCISPLLSLTYKIPELTMVPLDVPRQRASSLKPARWTLDRQNVRGLTIPCYGASLREERNTTHQVAIYAGISDLQS